VSGGIILVVLGITLMTAPKLLDSTLSLQDASTSISQVEDDISSTSINVDTLVAPTTNPDEITFSIDNIDEEKLWNFEKFNVFITYDGSTGQFTEDLSYAGTCGGQPASGTWCIDSISDDILDPAILNYGESLNIKSTVANSISSGTVIVVIGTDNGVTSTTSVIVP
jgi:hypothetical protein